MDEILLVVHDKDKIKYATSLARELTEKLAKENVKVTLFAQGSPASRMLLNEEGKISQIRAAGGEIISCVHDIQNAERAARVSQLVSECALQLRKREGAERINI